MQTWPDSTAFQNKSAPLLFKLLLFPLRHHCLLILCFAGSDSELGGHLGQCPGVPGWGVWEESVSFMITTRRKRLSLGPALSAVNPTDLLPCGSFLPSAQSQHRPHRENDSSQTSAHFWSLSSKMYHAQTTGDFLVILHSDSNCGGKLLKYSLE